MKSLIVLVFTLMSIISYGQNVKPFTAQEYNYIINLLDNTRPHAEVKEFLNVHQLVSDSIQAVPIEFSMPECQYLINVMAERPYKEVFVIIDKIFVYVNDKSKQAAKQGGADKQSKKQ